MSSNEKLKIVNKNLDRLMLIAENNVKKGKYECALAALSAYCNIQYNINQVYTDEKAENLVLDIGKRLVKTPKNYKRENNTVLFYDGFGLDLRGWGASFAKALTESDYDLIYVVPSSSKGKIPHIEMEVKKGLGKLVFIEMNHSYVKWIYELSNVFKTYQPKASFFYTTPFDVSGAAVFDAYKGNLLRIQVDLTDHAFWIGVNAFDYAIHSRLPSASNMIYGRGVPLEKIKRMDCCPYINREMDSTPLPFDIEHERYVFSGGSLYKTLGDQDLYYYRIVDHILKEHKKIKFLFAGEGDDSELKKIIEKYPGRAFHIHERSDFIRLFENCIFLLNTYPMFGGLMMRYAAMVGKVPLTLKHGNDHEGLLNDQDKRGIEFDTYEDVIVEADKLIEDEVYRKQKEYDLVGSVMTEEEFTRNVKLLIEEQRTEYSFDKVKEIDTREFRAEYVKRLDPNEMLAKVIPNRKNKVLFSYFPILFLRKLKRRIIK